LRTFTLKEDSILALLQDLNGDRTSIATAQTTFQQCYCRVTDTVSMGRDSCAIRVDWWLDASTRNEGGKQPIHSSLHYAPGVSDPIFQSLIAEADGDAVKALYKWLKTQPGFEGAIDA
jgi:hypothetical protein